MADDRGAPDALTVLHRLQAARLLPEEVPVRMRELDKIQ
jgi:hypothetical protein